MHHSEKVILFKSHSHFDITKHQNAAAEMLCLPVAGILAYCCILVMALLNAAIVLPDFIFAVGRSMYPNSTNQL